SIPVLFLVIKITGSPTLSFNSSFDEKKVTIQDIDGDGLPDVLHSVNGNGSIKAHLNQTGKTHLLKKVYNPMGGSWSIDYASIGNTYDMPQQKWVLSEIETY